MTESNSPPPSEPVPPSPVVPLDPIASQTPQAALYATHSAVIDTHSLLGLADALLRAPERAMAELGQNKFGLSYLGLLVTFAIGLTGFVLASFSGGWQYLAIPLKLVLMVIVSPLLCLPSLYIFSCLSESKLGIREVALALGSGLGVQALLLCALTPVAWVFSQSTNSVAFMGSLYLVMYLISSAFGLALTRRLLARDGHRVGNYWLWQTLFIVVTLQLTTTLRPIVGPFDGFAVHEKLFFAAHWLKSLPI